MNSAIDDARLDWLGAKYRAEREKRMAVSRDEIAELTGDFARYLDDPYVAWLPRGAVRDEVDAVVVGGGFGGILTAIEMQRAGLRRVRIIEQAGDVGGVWYWNRYPGAQCDVESYCYLPLLEETGYMPKEKYSYAPEILAHAQRLATKFGLYEHALLQTKVAGISWAGRNWTITTDRGDVIGARFLALATGGFSVPKLPAIPGIETFRGHSFHTSRWDYEYTGGATTTPPMKLADKTVAVIGTGATAVQVVPRLAGVAKELLVVQRTPSTVGIRANRPTDPEWFAQLSEGWQRERVENFTVIANGGQADCDLVDDGWTWAFKALLADPILKDLGPQDAPRRRIELDAQLMEAVRARISAIVEDPQTAEALKPYYNYLCKRPCFHDDYLPAFNKPGVRLIDTAGAGVESIYEGGLVVNGIKYPADCLIFSTGFESNKTYLHRLGFDIEGRQGSLSQRWSTGMRSLHGIVAAGFPNLFINLAGADMHGAVTINMVHTLANTATHIREIITKVLDSDADFFDVTPEAEALWTDFIVSHADDMKAFFAACTPGRYNANGNIDAQPTNYARYPGTPMEYFEIIEDWRSRQDFAGLEFFDGNGRRCAGDDRPYELATPRLGQIT
jgi:cation diffusion facilitator CzcD-associated flavoprotein CzcO